MDFMPWDHNVNASDIDVRQPETSLADALAAMHDMLMLRQAACRRPPQQACTRRHRTRSSRPGTITSSQHGVVQQRSGGGPNSLCAMSLENYMAIRKALTKGESCVQPVPAVERAMYRMTDLRQVPHAAAWSSMQCALASRELACAATQMLLMHGLSTGAKTKQVQDRLSRHAYMHQPTAAVLLTSAALLQDVLNAMEGLRLVSPMQGPEQQGAQQHGMLAACSQPAHLGVSAAELALLGLGAARAGAGLHSCAAGAAGPVCSHSGLAGGRQRCPAPMQLPQMGESTCLSSRQCPMRKRQIRHLCMTQKCRWPRCCPIAAVQRMQLRGTQALGSAERLSMQLWRPSA